MTFMEALADAFIHGELTEAMARDWLKGEDLAYALLLIAKTPREMYLSRASCKRCNSPKPGDLDELCQECLTAAPDYGESAAA